MNLLQWNKKSPKGGFFTEKKIYMAPLQGFTDYVYRNTHQKFFKAADKYFSPFIRVEKNTIRNSYLRELKFSTTENTIPQILCNNTNDAKILIEQVLKYSYKEINLNLGCPYPMVAKRELGSGLLENEKKLVELLLYLSSLKVKFSIKTRLGYSDNSRINLLNKLFNQFNLTELIVHPRIGKQLYKGSIDYESFQHFYEHSVHALIYNGDVLTTNDALNTMEKFKEINGIMIGRGLLENVFLFDELSNPEIQSDRLLLQKFHDELLYNYKQILSGEGHLLIKLKEFWFYFHKNFKTGTKHYKQLKKTKNMQTYTEITSRLFDKEIC